jgi:hypothetical protein
MCEYVNEIKILEKCFYNYEMEQHALKNINNGRGSTVNRGLDGSTHPG